MIQPTRSPRKLAGGGLRVLHVSLNSPVVALDLLPTGPASAAVAQDAAGALVCLRSVRARQTRFFASTEDLATAPGLALDAALSFAESLGFLFDEDEVGMRGAEAAARLWEEICGDAAPGAEPRELHAAGAPDTFLELEDLEEPADLVADAPWLDLEDRADAASSDALSKFRFFAQARGTSPAGRA